jgi:DNA mismatch repair protein MutS
MISPMMKQYWDIKRLHKDCLVFFEVGDFFELFYEDAETGSKELDLVLTRKKFATDKYAPMCGVPRRTVNIYLSKLVNRGYKVVMVEQKKDIIGVSNGNKSLITRGISRIVTRGTITDENVLKEDTNNFITCIYQNKCDYGIASADITTGEFISFGLTNVIDKKIVINKLSEINPVEIITNGNFEEDLSQIIFEIMKVKTNKFGDWAYDYCVAYKALCEHFGVLNLSCFGFSDDKCDKLSVTAAGALLEYIYQVTNNNQSQITRLKKYLTQEILDIDYSSRRNLEIAQNSHERTKAGSVLSVLDKTKTAMGARCMKKTIEQPLVDVRQINLRLDAVDELFKNSIKRNRLRNHLATICDIERCLSRISTGISTWNDLCRIRDSISVFSDIASLLSEFESELLVNILLKFDKLTDIFLALDNVLIDRSVESFDNGFVRKGYNCSLDKYRNIKTHYEDTIRKFIDTERLITGIKNLKVKQSKNGYFIEITNSNKKNIPSDYVSIQMLSDRGKYTNAKLKAIESDIYSADKNISLIEHDIFDDLNNKIIFDVQRIQTSISLIAQLDVLLSFAEIAESNNYVKPVVNSSGVIDIKNGRHPVVERSVCSGFIANDVYLDLSESRIYLITGPNMVGKSTYMRQVAIIVLMAQAGCFVPADKAIIGVVDKIFTRIGASDNLVAGQSTFMVEMNEVANILHCATRNSIVILDEVGRGTSTCDGLSIAWAVIEYISQKIGCRALFATHYHELTRLADKIDCIKNYCALAKKDNDQLIFERKIIPGVADNSYGIYVAEFAGVPKNVIKRAQAISLLISDKDKKGIEFEHAFNAKEVFYDDNTELTKVDKLKRNDMKRISFQEVIQLINDFKNIYGFDKES